jgi:hypothetical protein
MANVHWQWTPNPNVAGLMGIGLAFVVTVVVSRIADALRGINDDQRHLSSLQWTAHRDRPIW